MSAWLDAPDAPGLWWRRTREDGADRFVLCWWDGQECPHSYGEDGWTFSLREEGARWHRAEPPPAEDPRECTGVTAQWCPRCGDCKCGPRYEGDPDGPRTLSDDGCPLHAPSSLHGEAPAEDPRIAARREGAEAVRDAVMAFLDELFPGGPAAHVGGWPHALMECVAVAMSKIPEVPR